MARTETRNAIKLILVPRSARRYDRNAYESRRPKRSGNRHKKIANQDKRFVFWDGEGPRDAGYALFGNSDGYEICAPFLSSRECLDLLLSHSADNPGTVHISYGFNYDASMILHDLPWRCLNALHTYNGTWWQDYEIEHIPGKWFKVGKDGVSVQVFDIHSFFQCSYVTALQEHGIGDPADIQA